MPDVSQKQKQGFTLIELIIVIGIIGVLSSIVAVSMAYAPKQARDAKRKSDLELIRSGFEIYSSDCGSYPTTALFSLPSSTSLSGTTGTCSGNKYITAVPKDPISGRNYYYVSTGTTYLLCAALEIAPSPAMDVSGCGTLTNCGANCNYEVANP